MKILGICGSLAAKSVNLRYLKALKELIPTEHRYTIATLHDIPMFNPDQEECPESVNGLCEQIADADRIIFGIAEYNNSISGALKNAIDWSSRHSDLPFFDKKAAIMGASPGGVGTARGQYHLRQIGVYLNIHFLNKPEIMIGDCHRKISEDGNITDQVTTDYLKSMVEALLAWN